jgi:hypothetical protein
MKQFSRPRLLSTYGKFHIRWATLPSCVWRLQSSDRSYSIRGITIVYQRQGVRTALLALLLSLPQALAAQQVRLRGVALDEQTGEPIPAVAVQLLDPTGKKLVATLTDAQGRFLLTTPGPGRYRVRGERLGYFAAQTTELSSASLGRLVELRMSPHPVLLDSIMVSVKSGARALRVTEQLIHGRLIDDETHATIPGGTVELYSSGRRLLSTIADDHGLFRIVTPIPGNYVLRAERIGYKTADSPELKTMLGDTIRLDFYLSTKAVLLSPILVIGSARKWLDRYDQTALGDMFSRMKRYGTSRNGDFIRRDSLASYERAGMRLSDIIDKHFYRSPHGCGGGTDIYLNGGPYQPSGPLDDYFSPAALEAIELFTAPTIPGEFANPSLRPAGDGFGYGMPCRVIVLWTRRS